MAVRCKVHDWKHDALLMTNPPQQRWVCKRCGATFADQAPAAAVIQAGLLDAD